MDNADKQDKVVIAKTDADEPGRELGNRYGVQGFPSKYHVQWVQEKWSLTNQL